MCVILLLKCLWSRVFDGARETSTFVDVKDFYLCVCLDICGGFCDGV